VSAARLAQELEVSVRSIYRDVETLRGQGASIEGAAGVGYLLRPGFLLPPLMFTDDELEALVLGLRLTARVGDSGLEQAALDVTAKLRTVLPRDLRTVLDETALMVPPSTEVPAQAVALGEVRRALRLQRKARIAYENLKGHTSVRIVWPLGLGFFQRCRLLVAWCETREDFRTFRLDRIARWDTLTDRLPQPRMSLLRTWREREGLPSLISP
jgi:predicted DNA-binding transcriptional regulator YafY